jgi:inositol transporter-like SP family MFS transporter
VSEPAQHRRAPSEWWVGIVAGMASYIDASAIIANGIALVIYQGAIGLTPEQIGLMSAALTVCIAFGSFLGGRAGDRFGRRRVFLFTMALIMAGSALNTFGASFPLLFAGVVLIGLGIGADLPVSLATIAEAASDRNRGKILILSNILWLVGILASVAIAATAGGLGRLGGQLLFGQVGAVALLVLVARLTIPESASWLAARAERQAGIRTARAQYTSLIELVRGPYAKPFFALLAFYTLTNLAASTGGQFNTFIAVNLAGSTVEQFNRIALAVLPLGALLSVLFMRVVDTRHRMSFYLLGAVVMVAAMLVPAAFGFSLATLSISLGLGVVGGTFAFEGIMKVWAQESFPTMLRSSAQGSIIAFARISSALLTVVTPALLLGYARAFYLVLAVLSAIGLATAWVVFSRRVGTEFDREAAVEPGTDLARPAAQADAPRRAAGGLAP